MTTPFAQMTYEPVFTPAALSDLLEWCPVGTEVDREMWLGHLDVMMTAPDAGKFHGLREEHRSQFSHARDWARNSGLPVFRQKASSDESAWDTVVRYVDKLMPSTRQPLEEAPNIAEMTGSEILKLIEVVKGTDYDDVPEPRLELLLAKYYHEQKTTGMEHSDIDGVLFDLFNTDPLRLYSRLGIRFFLNRFQNQTRSHQTELVSAILMTGTPQIPNGRVVPIFRRIIERTSDDVLQKILRSEHIDSVIQVVQRFPSLGDLLPRIYQLCPELFSPQHALALIELAQARPEVTRFVSKIFKTNPRFASLGMELAFDDKGYLLNSFKKNNPMTVFQTVFEDSPVMEAVEDFWQVRASVDTECHWREYMMLRHLRPEHSSVVVSLTPDEILSRYSTWQHLATPVLIDMIIILDTQGTSEAHRATAARIMVYIKNHRQRDFEKPLPAVLTDSNCKNVKGIKKLRQYFRLGI